MRAPWPSHNPLGLALSQAIWSTANAGVKTGRGGTKTPSDVYILWVINYTEICSSFFFFFYQLPKPALFSLSFSLSFSSALFSVLNSLQLKICLHKAASQSANVNYHSKILQVLSWVHRVTEPYVTGQCASVCVSTKKALHCKILWFKMHFP